MLAQRAVQLGLQLTAAAIGAWKVSVRGWFGPPPVSWTFVSALPSPCATRRTASAWDHPWSQRRVGGPARHGIGWSILPGPPSAFTMAWGLCQADDDECQIFVKPACFEREFRALLRVRDTRTPDSNPTVETYNISAFIGKRSICPAGCTFNGTRLASQHTVVAYDLPLNRLCEPCYSEQRVCDDGVLTGSVGYSKCTLRRHIPGQNFP